MAWAMSASANGSGAQGKEGAKPAQVRETIPRAQSRKPKKPMKGRTAFWDYLLQWYPGLSAGRLLPGYLKSEMNIPKARGMV